MSRTGGNMRPVSSVDTNLQRLQQRAQDAKAHAEDTEATVGGFAARIAWDEYKAAQALVNQHLRIIGKARA